jgi:hypothetical protein
VGFVLTTFGLALFVHVFFRLNSPLNVLGMHIAHHFFPEHSRTDDWDMVADFQAIPGLLIAMGGLKLMQKTDGWLVRTTAPTMVFPVQASTINQSTNYNIENMNVVVVSKEDAPNLSKLGNRQIRKRGY